MLKERPTAGLVRRGSLARVLTVFAGANPCCAAGICPRQTLSLAKKSDSVLVEKNAYIRRVTEAPVASIASDLREHACAHESSRDSCHCAGMSCRQFDHIVEPRRQAAEPLQQRLACGSRAEMCYFIEGVGTSKGGGGGGGGARAPAGLQIGAGSVAIPGPGSAVATASFRRSW